ncbi:MAG TPA: FecR domain-containing protein, partial [Puia sp.]
WFNTQAEKKAVRKYLKTEVRNKALGKLLRKLREDSPGETDERINIEAYTHLRIAELIDSLPPEQADIWILLYIKRLKYSQIKNLLGLNVNVIKELHRRLKKHPQLSKKFGRNEIAGLFETGQEMGDLIFDGLRGRLTERRMKKLKDWQKKSPENGELIKRIREWQYDLPYDRAMLEKDFPEASSPHRKILRWLLNTAVVALLLGAGIKFGYEYFKHRQATPPEEKPVVTALVHLQPAVNRAYWSFDNGPAISSDSTRKFGSKQEGTMRISDDETSLRFQNITGSPSISEKPDRYYHVSTPGGNTHGLVLPDGTTIRMNAAADIRFPASFSPARREVRMEGQGYFEVMSPGVSFSPFLVHVKSPKHLQKYLDELTITVLSTKFDVRANAQDSSIQIVLDKGKLKIQIPGGKPVILVAGQSFTLDSLGTPQVRSTNKTDREKAWRNNEFDFRSKSTVFILDELGRWYGAHVEYREKPPGTFSFSGPRSEPIDFYLDVLLKQSNAFKYEISNDTIWVSR